MGKTLSRFLGSVRIDPVGEFPPSAFLKFKIVFHPEGVQPGLFYPRGEYT